MLATDLDTTVVGEVSHPLLEVRVHDVLEDELPTGAFDLVHLRLLLAWLSDPRAALRRLAAALKPSGWLLAEEMDFVSVVPDPRLGSERCALFDRVVAAHATALGESHRFDPAYGRRLAGELADAGLEGVECEGRTSIWRGGEAGGDVWRLTFVQLRDSMVATGLVSDAEVEQAIALCADQAFCFLSQVTMAAWGRRPAPA